MRRRFARFAVVSVLAVLALLAAACSSGDDATDVGGSDDTGGEAIVAESTTTAPTTTATIPPEAAAIPDVQIVFVEFGEAGYVEIANQGDDTADLTGVWLCQFPTYLDLGLLFPTGIPSGASIKVDASAVGGLSVDGGEAALYTAQEFTNPDAIFGFVQWGAGGARADVAAAAGIWPSGASVAPDPAFNSIELFGDPADPESWS